MVLGILAALGAGALWGLIFIVPLLLDDYPAVVLAFGRYIAFGLLAVGLAWFDRRALTRLTRADWIEATKLAVVGNLLYYSTLAAAIQISGAPVPTMIIGTLPVVIAITANLLEGRQSASVDVVRWRRLFLPLGIILAGLTPAILFAVSLGASYHGLILWGVGCGTLAGLVGVTLLVRGIARVTRGALAPIAAVTLLVAGNSTPKYRPSPRTLVMPVTCQVASSTCWIGSRLSSRLLRLGFSWNTVARMSLNVKTPIVSPCSLTTTDTSRAATFERLKADGILPDDVAERLSEK